MLEKDNELSFESNNDKKIIELDYLSKGKVKNQNDSLKKKILTKSYMPTHRKNLDNFEQFSLKKRKNIERTKFWVSIIDFIFVFLLLMTSSFNFNILYFPYIFLGFILSLYLKCKVTNKCKILSGIIALIYSLLLLIFKIFIIIKKENTMVEKYQNLLINLGIKILQDKNSNFYYITTFLGESILLIISLIVIIINCNIKDNEKSEKSETNKLRKKQFNHLVKKHLIICYSMVLCLAIFNISILTLFYILIMNILLLYYVMSIKLRRLSCLYKILGTFIYILLLFQIFFINLLNIDYFKDILSSKVIEIENKKIYYSLFTQIGINIMNSNDININSLSYFFAILSLLSFSIGNNKITFDLIRHQDIYIDEKDENNKKDEDNDGNKPLFILFFKKIFLKTIHHIKTIFVLNLCRILAIFWIYIFRNIFSLVTYIWLFYSFSFSYDYGQYNQTMSFILNIFTLISLLFFHIGNIDGFFENKQTLFFNINVYHIGLSAFKYKKIFYFLANLFYILINIFISLDDKKVIKKDKNVILMENIDNIFAINNEIDINASEEIEINEIKEINTNLDSSNSQENLKLLDDIIGDNEIDELSSKTEINLLNLIKKAFLINIDKISLVIMYFISINSINIIHFILVIIFMGQLLFPDCISRISKYLTIIIQIFFFLELIIDILNHYLNSFFAENEKLIKLIMTFDTNSSNTSIEIYFYAIVYCFYIEYQLYNHSEIYKKYANNKKLNLNNYIKTKSLKLKKIIFVIVEIIIKIYIFILISLFIFFDTYFELNILFEIKLFLFMIIVYQFLLSIQKSENTKISKKLNSIFLIYSSINTILVYIYQIISLEYFNIEEESDNFFIKNLPIFGFSKYKEDLHIKLLPHFACNLISILYTFEMRRIASKKEEDLGDNFEIKEKNIFIFKIKELELKNGKENEIEDINDIKTSKTDLMITNNIYKTKEDTKIELNENAKNSYNKKSEKRRNKSEHSISTLQFYYYFYSFILFLTKSYWLFLFLFIAIIFTSYDLSILSFLYILIFSITFICIFYKRIIKLNNYINNYSLYYTRALRYNIIEKKMQIQETKYYRSLSFSFLLFVSFLSIILFYSYGIFYLFQHGHDLNQLKNSDKRYKNIIQNEIKRENKIDEIYIQSLAYFFGFYFNSNEGSLIEDAWYHLFFALIIGLDAYIQNLENYMNEKVEINRKEYNEKISMQPFLKKSFLSYAIKNYFKLKRKESGTIKNKWKNLYKKKKEDINNESNENIINEIKEDIKSENKEYINNENKDINNKKEKDEKPENKIDTTIKYNIYAKDQKEEGKQLIENFLKSLEIGHSKKNNLSLKNTRHQGVKIIMKIYEEFIIFFLLCIAISKMNIWSIIDMIISLLLICTEKSMMKYYILYCFLIISILIQISIFISNLHINIDPYPDEDIIAKMNEVLKIPWYLNLGLDNKTIYFYGLGLSHYEINIIWMEFIEIIIIYIYLDYFSYSIYQDKNYFRHKNEENKINYEKLFINDKKTQEVTLNLLEKEYNENMECMKYNFGINIFDYNHILKIILNHIIQKIKKEKNKDINNISNEDNLLESIIEERNEKKLKEYIYKILRQYFLKKQLKLLAQHVKNIILYKEKPKFQKIIKNIQKREEQKETNKIFLLFQEFIFLSFHNIILIIILIISMMISGLISIIFIIYSLYFLIKSSSIYLGEKYNYPRTIKYIFYLAIFDIFFQIIYQFPLFDMKNNYISKLQIIGINKILIFSNNNNNNDYNILIDKIFLILGKALASLFMSFQILLYSSQSFREYYLSFIITKKYHLGRRTLMNAFKFNNIRINAMNKSINLRNKMSRRLNELKNKIEKWSINTKTYSIKKETQFIIHSKNDILNKDTDNNKQKDIVINEDMIRTKFQNLFLNVYKILKQKYIDEEKVKERIKSWILGRFLPKLLIILHQKASNYTNIKEDIKESYKKDIIQGKIKLLSELEIETEKYLKNKKLAHFTELEMKELKNYFDGTRYSKIKDKNKNKNKNKNELEKELNNKEEEQNSEKSFLFKFIKKLSSKNINIKKRKKKEKEEIIDLNQKKFKQFDNFYSSDLFKYYLSNFYLLKTILKYIILLYANHFYWMCYLIMILNHIMSYSIISLFYPLSIFCYAIFEYPRPKKSYWFFCLIYTLIILVIKFIINIEILREIEVFKDIIITLYRYKIGLKLCISSFSYEFFIYILFDILVLMFILINNYVLVSTGVWNNREQDIENIYQAMERIEISKNSKLEITKFNNQYLNFHERMKKEERQNLIFNKVLPVENLYNKLLTESNDDDKFIGFIKELISQKKSDYKMLKIKIQKQITEEKEGKEGKEGNILNYNEEKLIEDYDIIEKNMISNEEENEEDKETIDEYDEKKRHYFQRLFPSKRNEKPGKDYYIFYSISMTFIIIIIILFYTTMVQDKTFGSIELTTKQFSGEMVICLIIHIVILVYDRILYISQNKYDIKPKYILYSKNNKTPISQKVFEKIIAEKYPHKKIDIDSFILPPEFIKELNKKYDIIYIQNDGVNLRSIQKYILQIILVISVHIFTFFYCPMIGNWNIYNNVFCPDEFSKDKENLYDEDFCNDFINNIALIGFYILYVIYFIYSGLQIKYGFYDIKRKSLLKSGNNPINSTIYKSIKAIPFFYEIKLAIDWTFTKTCLDFFQWNKFESIYDIIYCTYCEMNGKNQQLIGKKVKKYSKISFGGLFSFALVFILIIPLMLFSSLNPTNQLNNLTGATLKIDLGFFYKNKAIKSYTLFENSKPISIENIEKSNDWEVYQYSKSIKTKNFPKTQIQTVKFYEESDKNWDLTWIHIDNLRKLIMNRKNNSELEYIGLIIDYSFERPLPAESME